jgi:hypothetical protein
MRDLGITITNRDKQGKPSRPRVWFVKVGNKSRTFDQKAWESGGIAWINKQLGR